MFFAVQKQWNKFLQNIELEKIQKYKKCNNMKNLSIQKCEKSLDTKIWKISWYKNDEIFFNIF